MRKFILIGVTRVRLDAIKTYNKIGGLSGKSILIRFMDASSVEFGFDCMEDAGNCITTLDDILFE